MIKQNVHLITQNGCTKKNNVQEMVHSECRNTPSKASCAGSETILDFVKRTPRGSLVRKVPDGTVVRKQGQM